MIPFYVVVFIFGAMIGSFLNVVIYRAPRDLNIVYPRSKCPHCNHLIPWYFNIPLLAWIFLGGKCHYCHGKISFRYFCVELLMGLMAVYLFPHRLDSFEIVRYFILFSAASVFVCHVFIDLEHRLLLDSLNIYLALVFILHAFFFIPWTKFILGMLIGGGFPFIVSYAYLKFSGREGLGMGDVKLFAVLGMYLGPIGILNNIFLSCLVGSLIGGGLILAKVIDRNYPIPFGPFIIFAASLQIFFPQFLGLIPFLQF